MLNPERYRLHAQMFVYKRLVERTREFIRQALELLSGPAYVACSFGKDSAALLHLARSVQPDIEARFIRWPETNLLGDYDRVIGEWEALGARVTVLDLHRQTLDEKVPDRWKRLQELSPVSGYLIGLRAEESAARRVTLRSHGVYYPTKAGITRIAPLAWWKTADVGAYVIEHQLPTLVNYQYAGFETRTASRVPRAQHSIREDALAELRARDPAAYYALSQMYPEVADFG